MRRLPTAILLIALLLVPAAAHASGGARKLLIDACRDEKVDGTYTQKEYTQALNELPADSDEYTACRQVIEAARLAALSNRGSKGGGSGPGIGGGGTGGPSGGGPANPLASASPAERRAIAKAGRSAQPVEIAGEPVRPGSLGLGGLAGSDRTLPGPLIALLALLAVAVLAASGWWLRTVVVARRLR